MNPTELSLFSAKEQTILVATEPARLAELDEDELDQLHSLVRRARNKYTKLYRRQGAVQVEAAGKRSATGSSNQRTIRKAEIFEDALARVSRSLSVAARRSADELKRERIALAKASKGVPGLNSRRSTKTAGSGKPAGTPRTTRTGSKGTVTERRAASTTSANARSQAKRDRKR